jgi:hypothetical protein
LSECRFPPIARRYQGADGDFARTDIGNSAVLPHPTRNRGADFGNEPFTMTPESIAADAPLHPATVRRPAACR